MSSLALHAPSMSDIASRLLRSGVTFLVGKERVTRPLHEWVTQDREEADRRRHGDERQILLRFAAALLERNVSGNSYLNRIRVFEDRFGDPRSLTKARALAMLKESGYRFPPSGAATLLEVTKRATARGFSWSRYFAEAEAAWESGFTEDSLRLEEIKGVGPKTRDFALSEFSDYYCAPDLHVCRIMARTGLILHGYRVRPADFSTISYAFVRTVVQTLARSTGFPNRPGSLSPAHIDRLFWYYGQDRGHCGAQPRCGDCSANDACLTGHHRRQNEEASRAS